MIMREKSKKKLQRNNTSCTMSKYKLLKTSCTYQFKEFFNNSNLHGVHFIGEKNRPFHEKFIWSCCVIISVMVTLGMIFSLWEKFQSNPTITGLDTDFQKWSIAFPAITMCLQDPTDSQRIKNFVMSKWGLDTNNDTDQFKYYEEFVKKIANLSLDNMESFMQYEEDPELLNLNLKDIMLRTVKVCEDLFSNCSWSLHQEECCNIFHPVLTDKGFCFTFNAKHYERNITGSSAPGTNEKMRYIFESDVDPSLKFSVKEVEISNPLSIFIHSSVMKIGSDLQPHHMWTRRVSKILFSSEETYTTANAKQLNIKQRRCVFPDEIRLVTDDVYTYGACMTQCRMNIAKQRCGCVPFFYSPDEIDGYESCDVNGLACIARHKNIVCKNIKFILELETSGHYYVWSKFEKRMFQSLHYLVYCLTDEITKGLRCDCELSCMNTVYNLEKLEKKFHTPESSLIVAFVSFPLIRYKRDVLFGWVDLFVAFGGIAGLFLGFSIFTLMETIYFFTLRACCMVYHEQHKLQQLQIEYANTEKPETNPNLTPYRGKGNEGDSEKMPVYPLYLP